jgi:glutaminyl-tRNA synthetase
MTDPSAPRPTGTDFIRQIVSTHVREGRYGGSVVTRFPPEPNGYMHIGHAKSICLNFGIAEEFGGRCHLRFDDTNPETENIEYVRAMQEDLRWLGFDWGEHLYFASDYFERMYECAVTLIRKGLAYVDSSSEEEIREARGTVTEPGRPTAYRDRPVQENLELFEGMRAGAFPDGAHVLRAKIDLSATNMIMRDPVLYRIRHAHHYRQGDGWCIYPLYDYAHCLEDAFEGITHSLCTLEFENNREIYDWILDNVGFEEPRPHQYEFNRLALDYTVLSKRKLIRLVQEGHVAGWDDPRMPTIAGLRRRGVPPEAIRLLAELVGVAKTNSRVDPGKLDYAIREVLNREAPRVMAVIDPLKVVITNWEAGRVEELEAPYWPHDVPREGTRVVPFSGELLIEREDFSADPPEGYRRLVEGGEVRLRHAYVIRCDEVVRGADGTVSELRCSLDQEARSGGGTVRKGIGTIHWVSAPHALDAEVRLYDRLFLVADPDDVPEDGDFTAHLNPASLPTPAIAKVEPSVAKDDPTTRYQFERTGYFWRDPVEGAGERLVFNRIVALKDTWRGQAAAADGAAPRASRRQPAVAKEPAATSIAEEPRVSRERDEARRADPELAARMERYTRELDLTLEDADVLTGSRASADFFDAALSVHGDALAVASWMVNDLRGVLEGREISDLPFDGRALGNLARLVANGVVSRRAAKDVLERMARSGGDPATLVEELGLARVTDREELGALADTVLSRWPGKVDEYRQGKTGLIGLFVGEVMKETGGAADPEVARALLLERLEKAR